MMALGLAALAHCLAILGGDESVASEARETAVIAWERLFKQGEGEND